MDVFFQNLLNASFHGSIVICVVLILRLLLKRAPKNAVCLLWLLVGLRLLMPFEIESRFSMQPDEPVTQNQWGQTEMFGDVLDEQQAKIPAETVIADPAKRQEADPSVVHDVPTEKGNFFSWIEVAPYIWLTVALGMGVYSLIAYLRLKHRVKSSVILTEGVWVCPGLDTAFVLGFFRPQIYLTAGISAEEQTFVLAHEKCHIRRGDHWWKLLGFATLAVHWFNPLVWVAYALMCRDLEMACDEAVIRHLSLGDRKAYSQALVSCAAQHRTIAACPVAFGEVSVKERIKSVMNYKKPKFWLILAAVVAVVVTGVCFLTTPKTDDEETAARLGGNAYTWEKKYGDVFSFEIELDKDGTCYFVDGVDPYYVGYGAWWVEDGLLKIRDDGMMKYRYFYFQVDGNDLVYLADKSAAFSYTDVVDGDRFYMIQDIGNAEEKLAQCKEAFENWSSVENYHVRQYNSYAGNILDNTSVLDYWKSGDDWLYTVSLPETDNGRTFCRLKKDGLEYQQEFYETLTDNPQGWPWFAAEESSNCMEENWYGEFNWENATVQYVRTDMINNNKERVTLRVVEDSSTFGKYCPYTVRFLFDSDGVPNYVYMTLEENKGERDWRWIDSAYMMCYGEDIAAKIEEAYAECLVVLGKGNTSGPVYCQDKDCTDSSHDHSSISCMDMGCTNAAHDHSARDCTDNSHEDNHHKH